MLQVTTENQQRADERLSILLDIPAKHKGFMAAPFIVFVKDCKTYTIPDKRTQLRQAYKSGLSNRMTCNGCSNCSNCDKE